MKGQKLDTEKIAERGNGDVPVPSVPEKMPSPSFWPVMLAFGTSLFFWGFFTSLIISLAGFLVMGVSIAGWIGEMSDE